MKGWSINFRTTLLWLLLALFFARVVGQIYVGLYQPPMLPVWDEWYSGLLPYPWLLLSQLALLMWMTVLCYDNTRHQGYFFVESLGVKRCLRMIAGLYAGAMLLRYVLTMAFKPDMRWLHGTIPIIFHCVLAGFIAALTLGVNHRNGRGN